MTDRGALAVVSVLLLLLVSCGETRGPSEVVRLAMEEAQAGDEASFLEHFTVESREHLAMYLAVATRYGHIKDDGLRFLTTLNVGQAEVRGDWASVPVEDSVRSGTLCLSRESGNWRIDLMANGDCLRDLTQSVYEEEVGQSGNGLNGGRQP